MGSNYFCVFYFIYTYTMEKLSLFDLLSFAIPGGTSITLIYWAAMNTTDMRVPPFQLPDILLLTVLLLLSYFMGHIVNVMGTRLESRFGTLPKSWVDILEENPVLSQNLNEISDKVFGTKFPAGHMCSITTSPKPNAARERL